MRFIPLILIAALAFAALAFTDHPLPPLMENPCH